MNKKIMSRRALTLLVPATVLALSASPSFAAGPDLQKAQSMMTAGRPAEAFAYLQPFEFAMAGDVKYDYLLGVAALDGGKPDMATIAFERVLAVDPGFAGARLDMARAYYQLGDITRAKTEFEVVKAQNPPALAMATIDNYLAAISEKQRSKDTKYSTYIEMTMGHDNNVKTTSGQTTNIATSVGVITTLTDPVTGVPAVKKGAGYAGVNAGGEYSAQIKPEMSWYIGADMRGRWNGSGESLYNTISADERAGLIFGGDASSVRLGLSAGQFQLDGNSNRTSYGASAEWRKALDTTNQINVVAQYSKFSFENTLLSNPINDFNQTTVGAGWLHILMNGGAAVSVNYFGGYEKANGQDPNPPFNKLRADGDKVFHGLRGGGQMQVTPETSVFVGVGGQRGRYDTTNVFFAKKRLDMQYDLNLGLNYIFAKDWTLRAAWSYTRNDSNLPTSDFDRQDFSFSVRRDF